MWNNDKSRNAQGKGTHGPEPEAPSPGDIFGKSSANEATEDVTWRSTKAEESKGNVLLGRKWWESSRQECKRVGYQSAIADASHCSSKVEEDKVMCKASDKRPNGHPDPSKDEDILVAKVVSQSSSHQDRDTTAKRVCCQEPRRLSIACHVESTTDLLHRICPVSQTSDWKELRQANDQDKDSLLKWRREIGRWSGCVQLASATRSGKGTIRWLRCVFTERSVVWNCGCAGRRHYDLCKMGGGEQSARLWRVKRLLYQMKLVSVWTVCLRDGQYLFFIVIWLGMLSDHYTHEGRLVKLHGIWPRLRCCLYSAM